MDEGGRRVLGCSNSDSLELAWVKVRMDVRRIVLSGVSRSIKVLQRNSRSPRLFHLVLLSLHGGLSRANFLPFREQQISN